MAVVAAVVALVLAGGGVAWSWWAISRSLQATATGQTVLPPTSLRCEESGVLGVKLSWTAPVQSLPTGASRQFVLMMQQGNGPATQVGVADTTTSRTLAPSDLPALGTYTFFVQSRVSFASTTWTSLPSNTKGVDRNWVFLYYLDCA